MGTLRRFSSIATLAIVLAPCSVDSIASSSTCSTLVIPLIARNDSTTLGVILDDFAIIKSFPTFYLSARGMPSATRLPSFMIPILSAN